MQDQIKLFHVDITTGKYFYIIKFIGMLIVLLENKKTNN